MSQFGRSRPGLVPFLTVIVRVSLKFDTLNGEVHVAMTRVDKLEDEVSKLATNVNQAYERLLSLERYSRDFNLRFYNIPEDSIMRTVLKN